MPMTDQQREDRDVLENAKHIIQYAERFPTPTVGMLAPYQPSRVAGFAQSVAQTTNDEDKPITKAERDALRLLSQRLLKA